MLIIPIRSCIISPNHNDMYIYTTVEVVFTVALLHQSLDRGGIALFECEFVRSNCAMCEIELGHD